MHACDVELETRSLDIVVSSVTDIADGEAVDKQMIMRVKVLTGAHNEDPTATAKAP